MKLTERKIETLATEHGRKDRLVFDDAQRGLAVRVTASGGRTYLCQYTLHGHKWRVPLGACSAVSLSKAREAAAAVMGDVAKGRNPAAERKDAAAAERATAHSQPPHAPGAYRRLEQPPPCRAAAELCRGSGACPALRLRRSPGRRRRGFRPRRRRARPRRAKTAPQAQGWRQSGKPKGAAMTGRTAAYGRAAFAWAVKRGAVHTNPFAALPVRKGIAKRERVLSDTEIGEIWRAAGDAASPYGTIIRLLILTGQRRGEVAGMTWGEISDDLAIWTLPGERTKNGAAHTVPLSAPARDLLRALLSDHANKRARTAGFSFRARWALPLRDGRRRSAHSTRRSEMLAPKAPRQPAQARRRSFHGACTICAAPSPPACSGLACGSK